MASLETENAKLVIDPQDALPESDWSPRRRFTFGTQIGGGLLIAGAIVNDAPASVSIALVVGLTFNAIFYLVAPSAEQLANLAGRLAALKAGIGFKSSTVVDAASETIETTAEATPAISPDAKPGD